jgi:hypothetical protein
LSPPCVIKLRGNVIVIVPFLVSTLSIAGLTTIILSGTCNRLYGVIWNNVDFNMEVDVLTIKPLDQETKCGKADVFKSVSLGLAFKERAIECRV